MYEAQKVEANPTEARAKCSLIRSVLQVWETGDIADDEALRAMLSIFQGAFVTPSGTQLRASRNSYDSELQPCGEVPHNRPLIGDTSESWPTANGGQNF